VSYRMDRPARKSPRLKGYDYAQEGAYFVTVCTQNRVCLFGHVSNGVMIGNNLGQVAQNCWDGLSQHYRNIELDAFVVMPNHVHGIIVIVDAIGLTRDTVREGLRPSPTKTKRYALTEVVRAFKSFSARQINRQNNISGAPVWQRSFHDHIIRDEQEMNILRLYVEGNPGSWEADRHYVGS
jgi:REP-associated tyrosine transposase